MVVFASNHHVPVELPDHPGILTRSRTCDPLSSVFGAFSLISDFSLTKAAAGSVFTFATGRDGSDLGPGYERRHCLNTSYLFLSDFWNPSVLHHPFHYPQDITTIVDPRMMPPNQVHPQRFKHFGHPLCVPPPVFLLGGRLDVDDPMLEVGNEEAVVGFGRGVCGDDVGELSGEHCMEVPRPACNEGIPQRVIP